MSRGKVLPPLNPQGCRDILVILADNTSIFSAITNLQALAITSYLLYMIQASCDEFSLVDFCNIPHYQKLEYEKNGEESKEFLRK